MNGPSGAVSIPCRVEALAVTKANGTGRGWKGGAYVNGLYEEIERRCQKYLKLETAGKDHRINKIAPIPRADWLTQSQDQKRLRRCREPVPSTLVGESGDNASRKVCCDKNLKGARSVLEPGPGHPRASLGALATLRHCAGPQTCQGIQGAQAFLSESSNGHPLTPLRWPSFPTEKQIADLR